MGKQQLRLIIIGVVIVVLAVFIALNFVNSTSTSANRDAMISDMTGLSSLALAYYRKPLKYEGGNNSFAGWQIPNQLVSTVNGSYLANVGDQAIKLTGIGKKIGDNGTTSVQVTMVVGPEGILSTTINN